MTKEKGGGGVEFDREYLTKTSFDAELLGIAETVFELGIALRQLIFWRH